MTVIAYILGVFITLPLITTALIYLVTHKLTGNRRKAFHYALDIGTVFVILCAQALMSYLWHRSFLGIVILIVSIVAIIYTIFYWRYRGEFEFKRVFRGIWRLNFLVFVGLDLLLSCYGLIFEFGHQFG
ncbi:DUF3397 domain-containing protein [Tuberibacillus sp. Marseille-P3662]|uniref:DUF3397 domain-containing protein n=1 Tax=Tuberibacillus sp. Marseille-P3662 TaxID=1965358 RepID=UPI001592DAA7|nr:DUF3397 domain-containing protein [Tuberibacillus sp. Marseille-P3662]